MYRDFVDVFFSFPMEGVQENEPTWLESKKRSSEAISDSVQLQRGGGNFRSVPAGLAGPGGGRVERGRHLMRRASGAGGKA